ncbi:hypothetical protein GCM10009836_68880 [Pseudonocardia ailaonensis]|uniref:Uncharacterized protein n=1 Tax=Pseudonocardia ailaonensis TaxID=367279 RepID=A0ABN2NNM1_9PSEU
MIWLILTALALLLLAALAYQVRCAISPFGKHGRRRLIYWGRGWWRGEQSVARDE